MGTLALRSTPPAALSLKQRPFGRLCALYGLTNDAAIAAAFGVTPSSVWKVRNGQNSPGERFIAGLMRAWPGVDPREVFEPVEYVPRAEREAVPA